MRTLSLLSLTCWLIAASSAWPAGAVMQNNSSSIKPAAVAGMIDRFGGEETVSKLIAQKTSEPNNDLGLFDEILDGIASGDPAWLALVPRLETGGHAAAGESMPIAVAFALPLNPRDVLRLIASDRRWLVSCGYPMIEPTKEEERAYFEAAIPAVRAVRDAHLETAKAMCLSELSRAEQTP
jgi:hypothetical protein